MPQPRRRPEPLRTEYVYRRSLTGRELLPAVGVGVGVGLAAFYVARLLLQRTPLDIAGSARERPRPPRRASGA